MESLHLRHLLRLFRFKKKNQMMIVEGLGRILYFKELVSI